MNRQNQQAAATEAEDMFKVVATLQQEIGKVIVGQQVLIKRLLTALFAAIPYATLRGGASAGCGHVLLEGVPGLGKTLLVHTLGQGRAPRLQPRSSSRPT